MYLFCFISLGECDLLNSEVINHHSTSTQTECRGTQLYSAKNFDDSTVHFYTGLETHNKFVMALHTLGLATYSLQFYYGSKPCLSVEDEFLFTLIKL